MDPTGGHHGANLTAKKIFELRFLLLAHHLIKMPTNLSKMWTRATSRTTFTTDEDATKPPSQVCEIFDLWHTTLWAPFRLHDGTSEENRASWSEQLDDAHGPIPHELQNTPSGVLLQACVWKGLHLPIELSTKPTGSLKQANFDPVITGDHRKFNSDELNELRNHVFSEKNGVHKTKLSWECLLELLIYKAKTKELHDSKEESKTVFSNRIAPIEDSHYVIRQEFHILSFRL
ncbi:hypothetical protein Tco_0796012 [Tanacetum coccineum]